MELNRAIAPRPDFLTRFGALGTSHVLEDLRTLCDPESGRGMDKKRERFVCKDIGRLVRLAAECDTEEQDPRRFFERVSEEACLTLNCFSEGLSGAVKDDKEVKHFLTLLRDSINERSGVHGAKLAFPSEAERDFVLRCINAMHQKASSGNWSLP